MRSTFVSWLILSFLAVAVFGFLAMNMENERGHANCIAAVAGDTTCPEGNAFASALFHITAYKNFSAALVVLALMLPFGLIVVFGNKSALPPPNLNPTFQKYSAPFKSSALARQLIHWLALHENSPSFL